MNPVLHGHVPDDVIFVVVRELINSCIIAIVPASNENFVFSSQFEELANALFERVRALCMNLLAECEKKPNEIQSVELVGGSSRIPAIKKIIAEVFGQEPKTTMNQDEAVARGEFMVF